MVKSLSESGALPIPVASAASFLTVSFVIIYLLILQSLLFAVFGWRGTLNIAITVTIVALAIVELIPVRRAK
jgi:hypothetical protein